MYHTRLSVDKYEFVFILLVFFNLLIYKDEFVFNLLVFFNFIDQFY